MPTSPMSPSCAAQQRMSRHVLLATDLQQSILVELNSGSPDPFAYTPYGLQSGPRQAETHPGFNGQLKEPSNGWYHLGNGHRVFNPRLMRFHSPDQLSPFGKGGLNPYAYCKGDPLNYQDPTGKWGVPSFLQPILNSLLHTAAPVALTLAPKATGAALQATRFSLAGSITTVAGAGLQLAGFPVGAAVVSAGTVAQLVGAGTRVVIAARNAARTNTLWKTLKDNVKHIAGWKTTPKAVQPDVVLEAVSISKPAVSHAAMAIRA